ncbi:uncharacterized protein EV420DRAFT_1664233 [Desarmillaria tabescens]|uniref:Uncharacterized protein n=1 Tax=Armillaria tabescens TaxID=1929756 RepID=A0AA39NRE6_ARMTA|nr:uncharacterized protein EV420DRAFT_1664233 [Desarmillaria tabescens]KAK0470440.1 hypothetical protein EV420DRAFT_1664233 [Desarmillaria tabescens]
MDQKTPERATHSEVYTTDDIFSDMKFKFGSPQSTDFSSAHLSQFTLTSSQGPNDYESRVSLSQPPCPLTQPTGDVDVYLPLSQDEGTTSDYEIAGGNVPSSSQREQYTSEDGMDSDDISRAQGNPESGLLNGVRGQLLVTLNAATDAILNALARAKNIPNDDPELENLLEAWRGIGSLAIALRKTLHTRLEVAHDPDTDKYWKSI